MTIDGSLSSQLYLIAPHLACPGFSLKHNLVKILQKSVGVGESALPLKVVFTRGESGLLTIDILLQGIFLD